VRGDDRERSSRSGDDPAVLGKGPLELFDRYPTTLGIVIACVFVFGFAVRGEPGLTPDPATLVSLGAVTWPGAARQPWRLLAAAFLHAGPLHLVLNLLATWSVGRLLEVHLGSARLWIVWVSAAFGATMAAATRIVLVGGPPSVGASGAAVGLLAVAFVLGRREPGRLGGLVLAATPWALGAGISAVAFPDGVDHAAHLGGAAAGLAVGWRLDLRPGKGDGPSWTVVALLLVAAAFASIAIGALSSGASRA
jgi:rhomboid protease GluP